jgi:adenylate cyclase
MTKTLGCEAIISEEVRATAGLAAGSLPQQQVSIRGRVEPIIVGAVENAEMLSALVDDKPPRLHRHATSSQR